MLPAARAGTGVRGILFAGVEPEAVELEEQDGDHEVGAPAAVDERVVADDGGRVLGGEFDDAGVLRIGEMLPRPGECQFQQAFVAQSCGAAVQCQKALAPDGIRYAASLACSPSHADRSDIARWVIA